MEDIGPYDILDPGAITEDVDVPFKHQGEVIGTAVVHPDGTADITIFEGPHADTYRNFLSDGTFSNFGLNVDDRDREA